jgi:3',5'-cyclic-AMP phosphodiesterase
MKFVQISDIHAGENWMYNPHLLELAVKMINKMELNGVLIPGDLTDWGLDHEYDMVLEHLDKIEHEKYIVPGNHDARIAGFKMFDMRICCKRGRFFSENLGDIQLIGLDSSEPDIDDGHVGREQLDWFERELKSVEGIRIPVVMLHHHLVPVPNTGRERNILTDAGDVLDVIIENMVPLVLTGHKHNPWLWNLNGTFIYSGGTVSCRRTAVSNSLSVLDIDRKGLKIERIDLPSKKQKLILQHKWKK